MRARISAQPHLEYRPSGFHWRRRWPRRILRTCTPSRKISLLFPLRSHVLPDAKVLAQKLTLLSDIAFAEVTERTMAIAPDIMERLLVELCRFLIEVADVARETAPMRTPEVAAYELACADAAVATLRQGDRHPGSPPRPRSAPRRGRTPRRRPRRGRSGLATAGLPRPARHARGAGREPPSRPGRVRRPVRGPTRRRAVS